MRRFASFFLLVALAALTLATVMFSASQAPRFFYVSPGGDPIAAKEIATIARSTELSSSFTVATTTWTTGYEYSPACAGHSKNLFLNLSRCPIVGRTTSKNTDITIYEAPNRATVNGEITVGPLSYFPFCGKYEVVPEHWTNGPQNVMNDLDLLISAQRVVKLKGNYSVDYVSPDRTSETQAVVEIAKGRVIKESIRTVLSGPSNTEMGIPTPNVEISVDNYSHFNDSTPISKPPSSDLIPFRRNGHCQSPT